MKTEDLRALVDYDPKTGALTRKVDFAANAKAGTPISCRNASGYIQAVIQTEFFYGHRMAWQIFYGEPAEGRIDHINGDVSDNRISNLRLASAGENMRNTRVRKDNKSGVKGVHWHAGYGKWVARIHKNKRRVYEGYFDSLEDAAQAVRVQRLKHHENFSNHG
ncbi:HNH endonuclease [Pseudomonas chlororaphis]|uniref:HNH endonuclease n=1 Tax=Pseudomonas chlororaphis TaxID=587753 RepID=UPI002FCD0B33|nr:HNH endonuclease [Pseudomonas chlororaphis]